MRVIAIHSHHTQCGIREYGLQLDRAISRYATVIPYAHDSVARAAWDVYTGDIFLVHFEPSLIRGDFIESLERVRQRGGKVVMCCHWYIRDQLSQYDGLVDQFVLHRPYKVTHPNAVQIPLGCPEYTPSASREEIRGRLGLPQDAVVITTLGFLSPWKKLPVALEALLNEVSDDGRVVLQLRTPWPFHGNAADEEQRVREVIGRFSHKPAKVLFSTEFVPEQELLDRVHASDLGFIYYPVDTESVSAAAKQFVSARCPVVITGSTHTSDIQAGARRVYTTDPWEFARNVAGLSRDHNAVASMRQTAENEYARLNMDATARAYVQSFRGLQ